MLVKHLFCSLMERLDGIETEWNQASSSTEREKLYEEMMELRHVSDDILDHWLLFEERIGQMQKKWQGAHPDYTQEFDEELENMPDEVAEKIFAEIKKQSKAQNPGSVAFLSGEGARAFRKGQGYYNLLMFPQASEQFRQVVLQEPDLEIARMYLAFSEMMKGHFEEADRHFQLVSQTADQGILRATALNAQGCMLAGHEKWEQALLHFQRAIESYPQLKDPFFNKALVLTKQGKFREAKPLWLELAKQSKEDWEVHLQLAECCAKLGEDQQAEFTLRKMVQATEDPEVLWEAAKLFEDVRQFGNAGLCYRLLLNIDPDNPMAWHGLGWNTWHAEGFSAGLEYIQKAITMSPYNADFQFSYGWILFHLQDYAKAEQVLLGILAHDSDYPLAIAGLAQLYLTTERWVQAENCCHRLMEADESLKKALGHLQMGRVNLAKGLYEEAKEHLQQSLQESPEMKDSCLWLGLTHYLLGEKEEAMNIWGSTH